MKGSLAFDWTQAEEFEQKIRQVIPLYDEIQHQVIDLVNAWYGSMPLEWLDTGCGTGSLGALAMQELNIEKMVLCDPSPEMIAAAKARKLKHCKVRQMGSEELRYRSSFNIVTAIQSHHYFSMRMRAAAVRKCYRALRPGGMFICFENTAPETDFGRELMLRRIELYGITHGRTEEEALAHTARYGKEFFPITAAEHLQLLRNIGFAAAEQFWCSYMQCGFYAIKV